MKAKGNYLQMFFLGLIGLYPLLKFDWSSKILILFCILAFITSILTKHLTFTKKNIQSFALVSSFFALLVVSMLYSYNSDAASKRIVQLSPLIIVPFLIYIANFKINKKAQNTILTVFVGSNILYTIIILFTFFTNTESLYYDNLGRYLFDYDKFQYDLTKSIQSSIVFMHKPYFSMGFVLSAVFCLQVFLQNTAKKKMTRFLFLAVFIYFTLWIFYAFSFPNVLALIICVVLVLLKTLSRVQFAITLGVFLVLFSTLLIYKFNDSDVQRGLGFVQSLVDDSDLDLKDSRKEIYKSYQSILTKSSTTEILFGFGVGDVQDKLNEEYRATLEANKSKNLLFFSEELDRDYWYKNNITAQKNHAANPFGNQNAELISANESDSKRAYNMSFPVETDEKKLYTFSTYAKEGVSHHLIVRLGDMGQRAVFNLKKNTVVQKLNVESAQIQQAENGWYRCIVSTELQKDGLALVGIANEKGEYVYANDTPRSLYLWGTQLEIGKLTTYEKNENEQIHVTIDKELNTHNNYLYFLMATGVVGLILFLISMGYLFRLSIKPYNVLKVSFCVIIFINLLTENILSRHWGLMFFAFILIVLFSEEKKTKEA